MKKYKPEPPWIARGNLVYNLRHDGWRGGAPLMCNDVAVSIEARHLPKEVQREIAETIAKALNNRFMNNGGLKG